MKAILQYRASPLFRRRIEALKPDWLEVLVIEENDKARFDQEMRDTDVLLHVLERVPREVIEAAPQLKLIQKIGVGVDTIDLDAARERKVAVANMPGTNSRAVGELTVLLMLAALRRLKFFNDATAAGRGWASEPATFDKVGEIGGRTVGLIGYGAVARCVAPILQAMGARVLCVSRREPEDAAVLRCSLAQLLSESDIVSLHVPLNSETSGLINRDTIAQMKAGAILVNTARGGLAVEADLIEALESGRLAGLGLDVFGAEPVDPNNPLLALENVIVTPHIAWMTPETLERSLGVGFENCRRVRDGQPLLHQVL